MDKIAICVETLLQIFTDLADTAICTEMFFKIYTDLADTYPPKLIPN